MSENIMSENVENRDLNILSEFVGHPINTMEQIKGRSHYYNMDSELIRQFIQEDNEKVLKLPKADIIRQREKQREDICRYLYEEEIDLLCDDYDPRVSENERLRNGITFVRRERSDATFIRSSETTRMLEAMSDLFSFEKVKEAIVPTEEDPAKKEKAYERAVLGLFNSYPVQFRLYSGYLTAKYIKHYQAFMKDYMNTDTPQKEFVIPGEYHLPYLIPRRLRVNVDPNLISDRQEKKLRDMGFHQDGQSLCRRDCTGDDIRDIKVILGRRALFGYAYENNFGRKSLVDLLEEKPVVAEDVKTATAEEVKKEEKPKKAPSKIVSGIFTVLAGVFELFAAITSLFGLILAIIKVIPWWGFIIYAIIVLAICIKLSAKGDEYNEYQRELKMKEWDALYGDGQKQKRNTAKNKRRGGYGEEDF